MRIKSLRIEDGMFVLAQERAHGQPAEDHRRQRRAVGQVEQVVFEADGPVGDAAPVKRGEEWLEPLRMLVDDGQRGTGGHDEFRGWGPAWFTWVAVRVKSQDRADVWTSTCSLFGAWHQGDLSSGRASPCTGLGGLPARFGTFLPKALTGISTYLWTPKATRRTTPRLMTQASVNETPWSIRMVMRTYPTVE